MLDVWLLPQQAKAQDEKVFMSVAPPAAVRLAAASDVTDLCKYTWD